MDSQQALNSFWNGFGWNAWEENTVPDGAVSQYGHYLTYSAAAASFDEPIMLSASCWERSTSWAGVLSKAAEIQEDIGYGGKFVPFDGGAIWIKRGVPFSQRMSDEDDTIRRVYINIEAEYIHV